MSRFAITFSRNAASPSPPSHDVTRAIYGKFIIEDWHNFGYDYGLTAAAWYDEFLKFWPKPEKPGIAPGRFNCGKLSGPKRGKVWLIDGVIELRKITAMEDPVVKLFKCGGCGKTFFKREKAMRHILETRHGADQ
ncbi:Cyclopropane-fatty-acyl-phospholipid synthase [Folsomia candida]|uniref:Cyclopropane-fatty-acyl-phospholipid synthase n=1 Tax=Folsomia candida TaxID=158441 RepID=A0A226CZM8_FOLCA|nr:Cyclopropane-fatty-acyl-phospholipid synthase [Folsomia candida]